MTKPATSAGTQGAPRIARIDLLVGLVLVLANVAIYARVVSFEFTNFDDPGYVTLCNHVLSGPSLRGILWAFTSMHAGCWHPLTSISMMIDAGLAGPDPRVYHLVNLLLHIANTLLLFALLNSMTGDRRPSAFVGMLFAVHPLHVESVAWIASRKDVLSTLFALLTLLAYVRYARAPAAGRYMTVALLFTLGLLCKPILVTLPGVMLLLDYWPLGRLTVTARRAGPPLSTTAVAEGRRVGGGVPLLRLGLEKLPFVALSVLSSVITYIVWRKAGSVGSLERFPPGVRVANALVAYSTYLEKTFWPTGLAVFYPHPRHTLPAWEIAAAAAVLTLLTVLSARAARSRGYVVVGWAWFLITLVPVIGFVQVGLQAMADRWTYFSLIGIFIVIAWGAQDLVGLWFKRQRAARVVTAGAAAAWILVLMACARAQVGHWHDSVSLFEHTLSVTSRNALAHKYLGMALEERDRIDEGIAQYAEAVRIDPDYIGGRAYLARALAKEGRLDEALSHFIESIRIEPGRASLHVELADVFVRLGRTPEALAEYREAIRIDPSSAEALAGIRNALATQDTAAEPDLVPGR